MLDEPLRPSTRQLWGALLTTALTLGVMATLRWMDIPAGDLLDWLVGIGGFWWLVGITTVPWNLFFGARAVQSEFVLSSRRGLVVDPDDAAFVARTAKRSLTLALGLHALSAVGFAALAATGLSPVGWFAASAALALTFFRPVVRMYRHVAAALGAIGRRTRYPRDDVRMALDRLADHELRLEADATRFKALEERLTAREQELRSLRAAIDAANEANEADHRRLARDAERAPDRLGEDSAFLGNVREIIRFVKHA